MRAGNGGQLNPEWVEWLMGWPIGWTASRPLGMDKFRRWWSSHGESYQEDWNNMKLENDYAIIETVSEASCFGEKVRIRKDRIHTDGKPRRSGFDLIPKETPK